MSGYLYVSGDGSWGGADDLVLLPEDHPQFLALGDDPQESDVIEVAAHIGIEVAPVSGTCRHCERVVVKTAAGWVDIEATGDDSVWRETCDSNESFDAPHEVDQDDAGAFVCAECATTTADTYVVTTLDPDDVKGTRTEVCMECHMGLNETPVPAHKVGVEVDTDNGNVILRLAEGALVLDLSGPAGSDVANRIRAALNLRTQYLSR